MVNAPVRGAVSRSWEANTKRGGGEYFAHVHVTIQSEVTRWGKRGELLKTGWCSRITLNLQPATCNLQPDPAYRLTAHLPISSLPVVIQASNCDGERTSGNPLPDVRGRRQQRFRPPDSRRRKERLVQKPFRRRRRHHEAERVVRSCSPRPSPSVEISQLHRVTPVPVFSPLAVEASRGESERFGANCTDGIQRDVNNDGSTNVSTRWREGYPKEA